MVLGNSKRKLGRIAIKKAKKQFKDVCQEWRDQVKKGNIEYVKVQLTEQILQGVSKAKQTLQDPNVEDEEVQKVFEKIDPDKIEHEPTQRFMTRLKSIENNQNEMIELINDFEQFYVEKLEEMSNK